MARLVEMDLTGASQADNAAACPMGQALA